MERNAKESAIDIFHAALKAVDPYAATKIYTDRIKSAYKDGSFKKLIAIGFGKAACSMAKAAEDELGDLIDAGIIITKYGHVGYQLSKIEIIEAGHPIPDENGLRGTEEIIKLLKPADENTLIVCLISGGGSALLVSPYNGITLNEKQKITELLLKAGADIYELNTVRKHISQVKGGRIAEIAYPSKIISLILSDVISDRLDVIASGPTSPDNSTFNHAIAVIEKYGLTDKCPAGIIDTLKKGTTGEISETPKEENKIFQNTENIIIGSNQKALKAAKAMAESLGLQVEITSSEQIGEARDIGKRLAKKARKALSVMHNERICLISGGETTVTVKGSGKGGRNMELALSFAIEIEGVEGITMLSAGTDGNDGPTDAAGAIVDGETVEKARAIGLDPLEYLANNDSYNFLKKIDGLFITGPTGTNVMDLQIILVNR